MNHIQNIEIKNFKSIRHQTIKNCRRVNIFIGYPNVGKSNILEALSLFSIEKEDKFFSNFVRMEASTTLFFDGEVAKQSEVKINDKHRYVLKFENKQIYFSQQFEREGTSFDALDNGNSFLDERTDVLIANTFTVKHQIKKSNNKTIIENIIDDFRSGNLPTHHDMLMHIKRYIFLKNIINTNFDFLELTKPFGDNLFNILSANNILKKEVESLFEPYNLELLYDYKDQKFTILKRKANGIFSIPYELVADTLQRLIFYKAVIGSNKNSALIFEEPEAHMFPPYISKFTSDIVYDENNNQYFIATHSPFVINDFMENLKKEEYSIYTVGYDKETGETLIRRMTDEELHEIYQFGVDLFLNLENYLPYAQQQ